jgi:pimeloyl-ACP methyl ester carboxylesterase
LIFEVENKEVFASDAGISFDKKKHTIILIHGAGQSHIVWSLTEKYLSNQGCNVFSLDLPGHGNSEGESLKSIEKIADWLEKVITKIGIDELTILGHSQGCLIALEYNYKFSKKVKNLIFVAGSYKLPVNQDLIDMSLSGNMESLNLIMKWGYGHSKQFIGGNPLSKILDSTREIREILAIDLIACNNYKNGIKAIKKIKCPTLFIFGELDKMITVDKGKEFAALVPNSKIHVIKNCGHMITLENAFEMREKVVEFLKK